MTGGSAWAAAAGTLRDALAPFRARKIAMFGLTVLAAVLAAAAFAPALAPMDPLAISPLSRLMPPDGAHWFGTDHYGRDTLSRVVHGARMAVLIGLGASAFAVCAGAAVGVASAWFPAAGHVLMRAVDVLLAFPALLLALALIVILGRGVENAIIAVGGVYLATTARLTYSLALKIKSEPYMEAAAGAGAGAWRMIFSHAIPNLASPLLVQASFVFAFAQLQAASLDFLGLGLPPEVPSWGNMLSESRRYITRAPWLLLFPGMFIILTTFSLNLVGDALRDRLDPRYRELFRGR